jgi:hypothetical protein
VKTFYVQFFFGRRVVSFPFGLLDIADGSITARAWPSWQMRARSATKESIRHLTIRHSWQFKAMTIDDTAGVFDGLVIYHQTIGYKKLRNELERCGYVVVDKNDTGPLRGHRSWRR